MVKPNVIIFNPDEMRADVMGHLGNNAKVTPNIDYFVKNDAVSFAQAYCQNPVCAPSRCSFLTGLYPHVFGHRTQDQVIKSECSPMFKELKDSGYFVWMNNRNDFIPNYNVEAFKENASTVYFPRGPIVRVHDADTNEHPNWTSRTFMAGMIPEETKDCPDRDSSGMEAMLDFIKNRPENQPFCAFIGLFNPHPPYGVENRYFDAVNPEWITDRIPTITEWDNMPSILKYMHDEMGLTMTESDWKDMQRIYYAMCMKVDDYFGQMIKLLKEEGIYNDTDIYFLSDHGDFLGDYGFPEKNQNTFQDSITRVPLIIKPNSKVNTVPGVRYGLVELVDFYATVMDLTDVKPTHSHFGKSLRKMIENIEVEGREYVFCEGGRLASEKHCMEKVLFELDCYVPRQTAQKNDLYHTKATMIRSKNYKYVKRLYEMDEFYDLAKDPDELYNVINQTEYSEKITEMKMAMLTWYQETCDIVSFDDGDRVGTVASTLIERYVPDDLKKQFMLRSRNGGYTLKEFEDMCISSFNSKE